MSSKIRDRSDPYIRVAQIAHVQQPKAIKVIMKFLGRPRYYALPPLNFQSIFVFDEQLCTDEIPVCGEPNRTDYGS